MTTSTTAADPGQTPDMPMRAKPVILWDYIRPYRGVLAVGVVLGLLGTAAELATPLVTKWVLDGLAVSESLTAPITVLAVLLVAGSVIGLIQTIMLGTLAERIILATRTGLIGHLLRVEVPELARRPSGEMVARVTSDTLLIREATTSSIVNGVNGFVGMAGALVLMAVLDLPLFATTMVVIIMVGVAAAVLMPGLAKAQQDAQAEIGYLGGRLEGILRSIRTVKASRAEARESDRIGEFAHRSARKGIRAVRIEAWAWTITGAGINLAVMIVLAFGAWRVADGSMTVSTLIAFLLYGFQLMMPVSLLTMSVTALQSGLAAAARISEISDLRTESDDAVSEPAPARVDRTAAALELRDVVYRYAPDAPAALDGIDLTIPRRGHTAIVGPSGAGKTTIFSLFLKFLRPDRGEIVLDGRPLDQWTLHDLRARIAYVEQDTPLVPGTVRDNLVYAAPEASDDEVWRALAAVRMDDRVRAMPDGLLTDVTTSTLSGGERQRIALARALVVDPELLLLDEVTAQLDGLTEASVAEGIRRQATRGAVVTIAHRLSTIMDADQIVVLEAGRVRAVGNHRSLLATDELYRELVAAMRIDTDLEPADRT
ncbi:MULTISPECIES: ABC transporter ATP-binding protein [unclassified Gordonia (in: high G+C Gram-positive bacteria)]|uniref:ABC transporter ATP-binding protein n=1 Tax=unclassified Gordonia (in: high G+C Gram-positive bacteria) TaxID=2657482 RepID=UPI00071CEFC8|nr:MULTISPECIES: ABC transporter ATP-binding protein [unclassified Gordonia (in: high G+C Gram-positive bacteria)]KSU60173.1 ABC transporter permease [Gordonia sp. SGD-V-85]SCB97116.1 ATP-binding cassette, subfamily B [Gordonia sp. v-85]